MLGYSNELQMDLMYFDNFTITNMISIINSSYYKISMFHWASSSFRLIDSESVNINTYQVKLYNSDMDLV